MDGINWLCIAIGVALGYLVLPFLLSMIGVGGRKQGA